jgi:protein O-GlcNAc transferase
MEGYLMGIFNRFRAAGKSVVESGDKEDISEQDATSLIEEGHILEAQNRVDEAMQCYLDAIRCAPNLGRAHLNYGNVLLLKNDLPGALSAFRTAIKYKPDYAGAYYNIGNALMGNGQLHEAVSNYRLALEIKPDYAEVHCVLGIALKALGQFEGAALCLKKALEISPDLVAAQTHLGNVLEYFYNNGNVLLHDGMLNEAGVNFRWAVQIAPDFAEAHSSLGITLHKLQQFENAAASYRRALEIKPDYAEAHYDLGVALKDLGQLDKAVACYLRALEIKPNMVEAHNNLGLVLQELGQLDSAIESYHRALRIDPSFIDVLDNLLLALNYNNVPTPACYLGLARQYGGVVSRKVRVRFSTWQCADRPERLRVGLVSGDFRKHSVGYFLEGLITHIDPACIELIAYPTTPQEDELTARIRPYFSEWKSLFGKDDEAAARLIHTDGVHILLDLSGHTAHNRLPVFAWKPAPIQVSWLGYFATTGVAEMDYLLADEVGVPRAPQEQFSEIIWYLPDTRLCFTAPQMDLSISTLPALMNGHITFGCFQSLAKLGNEVLELWGKIFAALPNANLRLQCIQLDGAAQREQLLQRFQHYGIDSARIQLYGTTSREDYLAAHANVDIILDTFPYPGGTTTCEALWMGVPTLTLAGDSLLARQGASLLMAAGLKEWVATSKEEYCAQAITLASDLSMLSALRTGLRQQVMACPLFDAPRFARNLETDLWGMWQKYLAQHEK